MKLEAVERLAVLCKTSGLKDSMIFRRPDFQNLLALMHLTSDRALWRLASKKP